MKPELLLSPEIDPDKPVICVLSSDEIPDFLNLHESERNYAARLLSEKKDVIFINSFSKYTALVRVKDDLPSFHQHEEVRKSASSLLEKMKETAFESVTITGNNVSSSLVMACAEGLVLSLYRFDKYRKEKPDDKGLPVKVIVSYDIPEADFLWLTASCEAVCATRDMINEPSQKMTAHAMAEEIKRLGFEAGFTVEILDKSRIAALKMGGLLGVNRGSVDPPQFCIMEYKPVNPVNSKPLVLIGKGVILDTGGLNIKTGDYMDMMKADMAGGAAVAGAMYLVARTGLPVHIVAFVPATDNRPGFNAIAPGDVLTMFSGTTVEIMNTDAEGRLILADAISYSSKYDPMLVISIATLTGSAAMTFGTIASAIMGNAPEEYITAMESSGEEVFERVAPLPFWDEYSESLKSDIADIKNLGTREGGAIIAGKFLASFTTAPFIHIDIAGPAMLKKDDGYRLKEGPGTGVRLLAEFIKTAGSRNN